MRQDHNFRFSYKKNSGSSESESPEIVEWRVVLAETTLGELDSLLDDAAIIDYDGRASPDNYHQLDRHLEQILFLGAEAKIINAIGENGLLKLMAGSRKKYERTLDAAKRMVEGNNLDIALMATREFADFDGRGPYLRMVIPYRFDLGRNLKTRIKENWTKRMRLEDKGFKLFDVWRARLSDHVDLDYLQFSVKEE
jgi:hypothetical protein